MPAATKSMPPRVERDERVFFHGVSWADFETLLQIRGDAAGPRMTYLDGELELMSPSFQHERIKALLGRLLEAYAEERNIPLNAYGSWTLRSAPRARAVEPDECYVLGDEERTPDLAIEVIWTSGGLDKLAVHAGLQVREVWIWENGQIKVHRLAGDGYLPAARSELFPDLDLAMIARLATSSDQTRAVREFRSMLRAPVP